LKGERSHVDELVIIYFGVRLGSMPTMLGKTYIVLLYMPGSISSILHILTHLVFTSNPMR
jgi:hypothetical protein